MIRRRSLDALNRKVVFWKGRGSAEQAAIVSTMEHRDTILFPITAYHFRLLRVIRHRLYDRGVSLRCLTDLDLNVFQVYAKVGSRPAYLLAKKAGQLGMVRAPRPARSRAHA